MDTNRPNTAPQAPRMAFLGLNRWLQAFLTIIAGTVVAVIAWEVLRHFSHIIVLMLASFLLAYLITPVVERLEKVRVPRIVAILLVYIVIFAVLIVGGALLIGPLTTQLEGLATALPDLIDSETGIIANINNFVTSNNIPLDVSGLLDSFGEYVSGIGTEVLGGTLAVVAGLVTLVTDILLVLVIAFYLLLDGRAMRNRGLRLLPEKARERWFFVEATLNRVLGGYIRGQIFVALTVGVAAGVGSWALGVRYPLVIGVLAFVLEFVPMIGPVLGMVPAVLIAFFQSPSLALWTTIYFIVLQQIESNVIVPRVSGHAVGLHPLAALIALIAGFELGGLGGALIAVPIAGVIYVIALALYTDFTGQTELLIAKSPEQSATPAVAGAGRSAAAVAASTGAAGLGPGTPPSSTMPTANPAAETVVRERLASIADDQAQLIAQFEADEAEQAAAEAAAPPAGEDSKDAKLPPAVGPDDIKAGSVP